MTRTCLGAFLLFAIGCDESSSTRRPPEVDKQPLPADVMRAMLAPAEPCFRRFREDMPDSYAARVWVTRSGEGFLTVELRGGARSAFDACIVDAIRTARIPVQLAAPVEVPLAFDFTTIRRS